MKRIVLIVALAMPLPATAQDAAPAPEEEGPSLMERGARMFFRGLMEDVDPALESLRDLAEDAGPAMQNFLREMGPALQDLVERVDDFANYHPPEMLPNGDIILRRKTPEEMRDMPETPDGEIEL
ncbi:hypothetical protein [Primorskyibacter flagellatus]|nr:hypothetical protein [Primorskyibacter flagellatus]